MSSEPSNIQCTLKRSMTKRAEQDKTQKSAKPDQGLHHFTENTRNMGVILFMIGYHKERAATGSITELCKFQWILTYSLREIAFTKVGW